MSNYSVEVVFILDESGSMYELTGDTIGGFNSVMADHRGKGNRVMVTTVLFNDEYRILHDRIPVDEVPILTKQDYRASGCTALIDAIGSSIRHIEDVHRYIRPEDVPDRTVFMITTDGMENASSTFSSEQVKKMITEKQEKGWEFVFLAANIDAVETAKQYGIRESRAVSYVNDPVGTAAKFTAVNEFMELAEEDAELCFNDSWREKLDRDTALRK